MKVNKINCQEFERLLSDYIEGLLEPDVHSLVAEHALSCPLCHDLLSEVKSTLEICRDISDPPISLARLEARIIETTMPEASMSCEEFEQYLTDYLDGFLPAPLFHRWERHAILCDKCTDLPGLVVRSIALCYDYKDELLPVPAGLNEKILQATIGTTVVRKPVTASLLDLIFTIKTLITQPLSQLAPVAAMLLFVIFVLMQTAEGNLAKFYEKGFMLAEQTYRKGANAVLGEENKPNSSTQTPIQGEFVKEEEK